jgi:hypothetical protein
LGAGDPTCGPFPPASGLGFAGFFFSVLQPVFRMDVQGTGQFGDA